MLGSSRFVHRIPVIVMGCGLFLSLSMILAPATLPKGEVIGLHGRANAPDYFSRWKGMDPFHFVAYAFGDINCHQYEERSLIVHGNQMPVCARDVSIFIGLTYGALIMVRVRSNDSPSDVIMDLLPRSFTRRTKGKLKVLAVILMIGLLFVPTALDGGIQMMSQTSIWPFGFTYESTNPTRILTGFPMGLALGIIITALLMTIGSRRDDGSGSLISWR
jgi:uncharacterized membrane protein